MFQKHFRNVYLGESHHPSENDSQIEPGYIISEKCFKRTYHDKVVLLVKTFLC